MERSGDSSPFVHNALCLRPCKALPELSHVESLSCGVLDNGSKFCTLSRRVDSASLVSVTVNQPTRRRSEPT